MRVSSRAIQPADSNARALEPSNGTSSVSTFITNHGIAKQPLTYALTKRVRHPKVRTGCRTCKRRRLKCDEQKPRCDRCLKSGWECEGYRNVQTWLFHPQTPGPSAQLEDEETLQYFLNTGSIALKGYCASVRPFCISLAAQLGHQYPAVRSALLSIAARVQSVTLRWDSQRSRQDAEIFRSKTLQHYNDAIRQLTIAPQGVPPGVFVVCGLLFAALELWPHRDMAPVLHVVSAYRLLLRDPSGALPYGIREPMFPFLVFNGRNALAFSDDIDPDLAKYMRTFAWLQHPPPTVPAIFQDLDSARECTEALLKYILALSDKDISFTSNAKPLIELYSAQLRRALRSTLDHDALATRCHYRALMIHQRVLQIMLDTRTAVMEIEFDIYAADFAWIMQELEDVAVEVRAMFNAQNKVFHPTLGALSPLFFIATRCRQRQIRQRAIRMMHSLLRRERTWNSCIAAMLARLTFQIEEKSSTGSHIIPETARIRLENVKFNIADSTIEVTYRCAPYLGDISLQHASLAWHAAGTIDDNYECVSMSRKVLRASGYTGVLLVTPRISCQCGNDDYG